eukprot:COSAG04_NODE_19950_length_404_cov_1.019672_1_plen_57_part_10
MLQSTESLKELWLIGNELSEETGATLTRSKSNTLTDLRGVPAQPAPRQRPPSRLCWT